MHLDLAKDLQFGTEGVLGILTSFFVGLFVIGFIVGCLTMKMYRCTPYNTHAHYAYFYQP